MPTIAVLHVFTNRTVQKAKRIELFCAVCSKMQVIVAEHNVPHRNSTYPRPLDSEIGLDLLCRMS